MNPVINPLLLVTFFPLVGVAVLAFIPAERKAALRWISLATSLITFGISLWLLAQFDMAKGSLQLGIDQPWINLGGIEIRFQMGVDGLSLLMVLLTTFLTPLAILSTWSAHQSAAPRDFFSWSVPMSRSMSSR